MLKQLEHITNESVLQQAETVLMEQAILLAMQNKIHWRRLDSNTLESEVLLGLPGAKALNTRVLFSRGFDEHRVGYYFQLESKHGPCRNDVDSRIAKLVMSVFGNDRAVA